MEAEGRGSANPRGEGRMNGGPLAGSPRLSASPVRHLWVAMGPRAGFPPCFSEKKTLVSETEFHESLRGGLYLNPPSLGRQLAPRPATPWRRSPSSVETIADMLRRGLR